MKNNSKGKTKKKTEFLVDYIRLLQIKFVDNLHPVIRRGKLNFDIRLARLAAKLDFIKGSWFKMHNSSPQKLEKMMNKARQKRPDRKTPDLLSYYILYLHEDQDIQAVFQKLSKLKEIEFIDWMPKSETLPAIPDFRYTNETGFFQGYLEDYDINAGMTGIGSTGGLFAGAGIRFCDVEFNFNSRHRELVDRVTILGGDPVNPSWLDSDLITSHGTRVLGVFGSKLSDGNGTVGIAPDASLYFSPTITGWWVNIADAITRAAVEFDDGDIIIIEQQIPGPGRPADADNADQTGFVAVEWDKGIYDAIVAAVNSGITVIEAAGNGGQDFDNELFLRSGINRGHHPFALVDSGAIIVGAGDSRSQIRMAFSNFGKRLDVQGWGNNIVTSSGPNVGSDLWAGDGTNSEYTRSFSGTSGATPIVAGACALIQEAFKSKYGRAATCEEMRFILVVTGSPQQSTSLGIQKIGPLPNLKRATDFVRSVVLRPVFITDPVEVYEGPMTVLIDYGEATNSGNAKIRYTTDGSEPTTSSRQYITSGSRRTRLVLQESTLINIKTFLNAPNRWDGSIQSSYSKSGNFQILNSHLPLPDIYLDGMDDYRNRAIIKIRAVEGLNIGTDAMIWYNINTNEDPIQYTGNNFFYMGSIRVIPGSVCTIKARFYQYDEDKFAWAPGPVATTTFNP